MALGAIVMLVSEGATLAGLEPFASWNTPICWTGFILCADAIVYRARGNSWLRSSPREFAALALASIPLWLVFEGFNFYLRNWHYVGVPENRALRLFGYAWSFATIWPAIFEGAELAAIARGRRPGRAGRAGGAGRARREIAQFYPPALPDLPGLPGLPGLSITAGAAMLVAPVVAPARVAPYLAAPVFLGFIFLLDPINARLGAESLEGDRRVRRHDRLINLIASGFLCGILWEFWNYWAKAKWIYTVPILERVKIFEMPLPGYFGFPAFAVECFTMYVFVRRLFARAGRPIAM